MKLELETQEQKQAQEFTHFNSEGRAHMIDVTEKSVTNRQAIAMGEIRVSPETLEKIRAGTFQKGDVLSVAQIAGIQAAKHTWEIIPLCHPVPLTGIDLSFALVQDLTQDSDKNSCNSCRVEIRAEIHCAAVTGVEMEALTAVSAAALTIYDMCKSVQKDMEIGNIRLVKKTGGKSGDFIRVPDSSGDQT